MALRKQDFEVTTSLPTNRPTKFTGSREENVIRYADRPAVLVAYEFKDDALNGNFDGFAVNEVTLTDVVLNDSPVDEVPGRTIFNYIAKAQQLNNAHSGPIFPIQVQPQDVDNSTTQRGVTIGASLSAPVLFNTKKLEVEVFGGNAAADTITIVLYYESAGDYRF